MIKLKTQRHAVIDVGSNSLRLVIYDQLSRAPAIVLNHKVSCGLGRGLQTGGKLNPAGVAEALVALSRFAQMAEGMHVRRCDALATAAVRQAADGMAFVKTVRAATGLNLRVLSGEREAELAAQGVLSGIPDASGVMGDLGGGSLELVEIQQKRAQQCASTPLGVYALASEAANPAQAGQASRNILQAGAPWLADALRGRDFYLVGGNWRALAKLHMKQTNYPLRVVQAYKVAAAQFLPFADLVARQSEKSLDKLDKETRKRAETLPLAASVLAEIIRAGQPANLVFSAFGLRDGYLYSQLGKSERERDPLRAWAEQYAQRRLSLAEFTPLIDWTEPLQQNSRLPAEDAAKARLRAAACLFSDHGWQDHPDYRAEHGFNNLFSLPTGGLDHAGRAALALTQFIRYGGEADAKGVQGAKQMLSRDQQRSAQALGLALLLAYELTGGALGLLARTRLYWRQDILRLDVPADLATLMQAGVKRRFDALTRFLEVPGQCSVAGKALR